MKVKLPGAGEQCAWHFKLGVRTRSVGSSGERVLPRAAMAEVPNAAKAAVAAATASGRRRRLAASRAWRAWALAAATAALMACGSRKGQVHVSRHSAQGWT